MFKQLLKFELSLQSRQIGFWVVILLMFALGLGTPWVVDALGGAAGEKFKVNGAQIIAGSIVSWDAAAIFFAAIFVVTGILRDKTHNMLELVHSTPVKTVDMTSTRMVGIYLTVFLCILGNTVGQFLGQFVPGIDPDILGPVRPLYYLQPMILFTAVNALIITTFFTLIAGLTQNRMLVLVSAVGLFFLSIMTGMVTELDVPKWVQALVDPFGSIAYSLDTEFWPAEDRNERMLPIFGYVGLNRLVWGLGAAVILAVVFGMFKRGLLAGKTKSGGDNYIDTKAAQPYRPVSVTSGLKTNLGSIVTRIKFEYLGTVRSVPFLILAALAAALFAFMIIVTVFFAPQKLVPTSMNMVGIGFTTFFIPIMLIIAFFSGEMIWRDRTVKFSELLDSTPVNNAPLLLGKWLALVGILASLSLVAIVIGMIVQIFAGGTPVDVSLYLRYVAFNVLPNYFAFAFLALLVQSFAPNRIVGMIFAIVAMAAVAFGLSRLPFYHPLMGFSGTSPGRISEISPYSSWVYFRWFNSYFGALCGLFAIVSIWLWRRGLQTELMLRLKKMTSQITPLSGGLAGLFAAVFIGSGVYIYQAYDEVNWQNRKANEIQQAKDEKMLFNEAKLNVPTTYSVKIEADIYPQKQEAIVSGVFKVRNTGDEPITELYMVPASGHKEDIRRMEIDGATRVIEGTNAEGDLVSDIEKADLHLYKFDPPLALGAETEMRFETFFHAPRLADRSKISKNGTFLNNYGTFQASPQALPILGARYLPMENPDKRRKYDLPELAKQPDRTDMKARQNAFFGPGAGYIDFEANVCTAESQIPIAPGDFIGETVKDGRRCRDYKSDAKFINFYSILSGDFVVTEDSWTSPTGKVIPIRVYHGKNHSYSVQNMIESVQFGLSHFTENFGPYQFNYVRIMEVPFIGFAQAFAGTIPYAEQGFVMDGGDPDDPNTLDNAAQTTMHEMGHQWFAHQIVPALTRGYNVQSEGLTSYAALDAYEAKYGFDKARYALEKSTIDGMVGLQFLDRKKEEPLALASTQQYLVYNKADWVLWGLKHYIGPEKLRATMRKYLEDFGQKGPPYPTTLELTNYLREAAGPDYDQLITDQWDRITYWDLAFGDGDIKVSPNTDGTYTVEIPFKLDKKISTEEEPKQVSVAEIDGEDLNEWIEIGFYKDPPKDKWSAWLALEKVRVNQTDSTLSFKVKERPNHIALDPRRLLQERNVTDNVKELDKKLASNE